MFISRVVNQCAYRGCESGKRSAYKCECRLTFYCCRECQCADVENHVGVCLVTLRRNVDARPILKSLPSGASRSEQSSYRESIFAHAKLYSRLADALSMHCEDEKSTEARFTQAHLMLCAAGYIGKGGIHEVFQTLSEVDESVWGRVKEICRGCIRELGTFYQLLGVANTLSNGSRRVVDHRTWKVFQSLHETLCTIAAANGINCNMWKMYSVNSAIRHARYSQETGCFLASQQARLKAVEVLSQGGLEKHRLFYYVLLVGLEVVEIETLRAPDRSEQVAVLLQKQKGLLEERHLLHESDVVVNLLLTKYNLLRSNHEYDLVCECGNLAVAQTLCVEALVCARRVFPEKSELVIQLRVLELSLALVSMVDVEPHVVAEFDDVRAKLVCTVEKYFRARMTFSDSRRKCVILCNISRHVTARIASLQGDNARVFETYTGVLTAMEEAASNTNRADFDGLYNGWMVARAETCMEAARWGYSVGGAYAEQAKLWDFEKLVDFKKSRRDYGGLQRLLRVMDWEECVSFSNLVHEMTIFNQTLLKDFCKRVTPNPQSIELGHRENITSHRYDLWNSALKIYYEDIGKWTKIHARIVVENNAKLLKHYLSASSPNVDDLEKDYGLKIFLRIPLHGWSYHQKLLPILLKLSIPLMENDDDERKKLKLTLSAYEKKCRDNKQNYDASYKAFGKLVNRESTAMVYVQTCEDDVFLLESPLPAINKLFNDRRNVVTMLQMLDKDIVTERKLYVRHSDLTGYRDLDAAGRSNRAIALRNNQAEALAQRRSMLPTPTQIEAMESANRAKITRENSDWRIEHKDALDQKNLRETRWRTDFEKDDIGYLRDTKYLKEQQEFLKPFYMERSGRWEREAMIQKAEVARKHQTNPGFWDKEKHRARADFRKMRDAVPHPWGTGVKAQCASCRLPVR